MGKELVKKSDSFLEITRRLDSMLQHRIINCCLTKINSYVELDENIFYDVDIDRYSKHRQIGAKQAREELIVFLTSQLRQIVDIATGEHSYIRTTILNEFKVDEETDKIQVKFNKLTIPLISGNMPRKTFSFYHIDLDKISSVKQYLMAEYIQSRLWEIKQEGHFYIKISILRQKLQLEATVYERPYDLIKKVIEPTLDALKRIADIDLKVKKDGHKYLKFYKE